MPSSAVLVSEDRRYRHVITKRGQKMHFCVILLLPSEGKKEPISVQLLASGDRLSFLLQRESKVYTHVLLLANG